MGNFWFSKSCTHLDVGDVEIEAAIEAASRITSDTLQRWG